MTIKKYVGDIHWNELNQLTQPLTQPSLDTRMTQTATASRHCTVGHFMQNVLDGKAKVTGIVLRSTQGPYPYMTSGAEKLYSEFATSEATETGEKIYWRYEVMIPMINGILETPGSVKDRNEEITNWYTTAIPSPGLWGSSQEGNLKVGTFVDIMFENINRSRIPYIVGTNRDRAIVFNSNVSIKEQHEKTQFRGRVGDTITEESNIDDTCKDRRTPHPSSRPPAEINSTKFWRQIEQFGDNCWRSCQPSYEQFEWLIKEKGVKHVLRMNDDSGSDPEVPGAGTSILKDEERLHVKSLGAKWYFINPHISTKGFSKIVPGKGYDESIKQILNIMNKGNCLVHCRNGADRTGMAVACYKKTNGIITDLEKLWLDTIQYNSWGCKKGKISRAKLGYARYLDGFYPLDQWCKAGSNASNPSASDRKKSAIYSKVLTADGQRTRFYNDKGLSTRP